MKTLEEILIEYFGAKSPVFNETDKLTESGRSAYKKLEHLINDLNGLCLGISPDKVMNQIDEIINNSY